MLGTIFICSIQLMPTIYMKSGCQFMSLALSKISPFVHRVRVSLPPGPCCSRELQCHYWYRWSYGPIRPPQTPLGLHLRLRCHHFLQLLHCHWWWNQRQSWQYVDSGQSCLWWFLCHLWHQWSRGNSQSAGCPSLVWRDAGLQGQGKIWMLVKCLFSTYFTTTALVLNKLVMDWQFVWGVSHITLNDSRDQHLPQPITR